MKEKQNHSLGANRKKVDSHLRIFIKLPSLLLQQEQSILSVVKITTDLEYRFLRFLSYFFNAPELCILFWMS